MKFNKILLTLSLIFVALLVMGSAVASDGDINDDNLTESSLDYELETSFTSDSEDVQLGLSSEENILSSPKTIIVDEVSENHNEMGAGGTIQKAINSANAGDTIIINGRSYVHCHFEINKKLTIISNVGKTMDVCPGNTVGSGHYGIFYISPQASGTTIEGFTLTSGVSGNDDYGILVSGAFDVIIRNCAISNEGSADALRVENAKNIIIQNVTISNAANGIRIKNSENVNVKTSNIKNSNYGIYVVDSPKTLITSNNILNNKMAGIEIAGSSNNPTISFNNITNNNNHGIELGSCDNINILSNYIASNSVYGVHINAQVVQLNIIGNFFYKNVGGEIYHSSKAFGFFKPGGDEFEVINNNYMVGVGSERPVNTASGGVFLGYAFIIEESIYCPIIHFGYVQDYWYEGNYQLKLSEITQSKKGIYSISVVDANGNVAKGLSSVPVTFYLNKNNNNAAPQNGDVYKTVMMVDGTATARFYASDFTESGNILTVVLPGASQYITGDQYKNVKNFTVDDNDIPGEISKTKITLSNLNTNANSNVDYTITLTDSNNNPIVGESVTFNINSKNVKATTNAKGQATIKINQNPGNYTVKVSYAGDDMDYAPTSAQAKITVNKLSTKIIASNYAMLVKKTGYYQLTLKDSTGKAISGQKITIKVNKKTYTKKTNSKGVIKLKLKLKKGSYKVAMNFKGTSKYKAAKKTTKITVKKVLKTKLTAPKITTFPKTSTKYTVTLKDENGAAIKKQKVTVKVNGKKYTKKTNSKGQVKINVKFSKLKSYAVKATFKKTKVYKKSSATGKITVQKIASKITAPDIDAIPNTARDYTVTLKTSAGKAIAKQSLKIAVNGQTYTKTTNSNGQVTIPVSFASENTYKATVTYAGSNAYKASSAVGTIKVSRTPTELAGYDRTFSKGSSQNYTVTLKDSSGNALANQVISYTFLNQSLSQTTDSNGQIRLNVSALDVGSYNFTADYAQTNQYRASSSANVINIVNRTDVTFIDKDIPGDEIQARFDEAVGNVEFLGNSYDGVSLTIIKSLNITFMENTTLNGKAKSPVLTISVSNFSISNLTINANEGSGIVIQNADNVIVENNIIYNTLDQSKATKYKSGEAIIPGNGVELVNSNDILISMNDISSFGNAILAYNSEKVEISNNTLSLSNYGITYGLGVKNTNITNNLITKNIGLYVMDVPEGPLGYGIFLNQSAVNVSITHNRILDNYMGISVDANYSTGIVITSNWISDNALEGIRFNAGYDLAENAVEPNVNDNAIYRNAKGPSMMILGELSANPEGIYHFGEFDDTEKLKLGANWFGKNARLTWDYETNKTGYGTMCPRINATYISVNEIEVVSPGTYSITFYKYGEVASKLPEFEMYATLNDVEVKFHVINGFGVFTFNSTDFANESNVIKISIGSLTDQYRTFEILLNKTLEASEIPV